MVQWTLFGKGGVPMADKGSAKEFLLGTQASNLWLYTYEACANEKIIPKKYRYTVGSSLIQEVESICDLIEEANLLDTRIPAECEKRVSIQLHALGKLGKMQRKIKRLLESKEYPGVNPGKAAAWTKNVLTVSYMCAKWYEGDKARVNRTDARR